MRSALGKHIMSFFRGLRSPRAASWPSEPAMASAEPTEPNNPVKAYYQHVTQNHLRALYRFAIQSRSIAIRDVFAKSATSQNLDLADLLTVIDYSDLGKLSSDERDSLKQVFYRPVLGSLADLLVNTARDDQDIHAAVKIYDFLRELYGEVQFSEQRRLLYIESLAEAGEYERASQLAEVHAIGEIAPLQPELLALQHTRLSASVSNWLEQLNNLYEKLELTQVRFIDDDAKPLFDRLAAEKRARIDGLKVSIIMPTFSPGPEIETAIRSLLEQTWENLEIIIVDDGSPSEFQSVFSRLKRLDPRIQILHQTGNAGAYVARNAGLTHATGELITTADDDDWSHPDKIALQASALLNNPHIVATTSAHIRTTETLKFRRVNSSAHFLQMNYSSLMFRRQVVSEIGGWDTVNRGADSEFFTRVNEYYGSDRVLRINDRPLAFSRLSEGSLTSGEMYRGYIGTPRVMYLWAIRQWRWDLGKLGQKPTRPNGETRPYAVPSTMEAGKRYIDLGLFDVIYVADFFRQAKHVDYVLRELETLVSYGLRVGYLHLDSPRTTKPAGFPRALFEAQIAEKITQISLGDTAETKLLIVYDSALGMFSDQNLSRIKSHSGLVVERELPSLAGTQQRQPVVFNQALANLDQTFNQHFEIVGATEKDQARIAAFVPPSRRVTDSLLWRTHVPRRTVEIRPPMGKPVVGFHTFGNKYRWPINKLVFEQVYLSNSFSTHFYGQLESAFSKFGEEVFDATHVFDYRDMTIGDFLPGIDFWVYYPDPKLQDDVWEPVLTAMSAGKVVILPPWLRSTYQEAALYGQPEEVEEIVRGLSASGAGFEEQARAGLRFVDTLFSPERLFERVTQRIAEVYP